MKKIEKVIPYVLLISYLTLCHFRSPEISDSIIIIALAALSGFRAFMNFKEQPNYFELFKQELVEKEKKITDLQNSVGMQNIANQRKANLEKIVW